MVSSFTAEFLKLRKRPATWVLALVWFSLVVLFGYVLTYLFFVSAPEETAVPGVDSESFLRALLPANFLPNVLAGFPSNGGGPITLILGALAVGSEYGWETFKTSLTQRPGRLRVFFGKMLALGILIVGFVLLAFVAGAASSLGVAYLEDGAVEWPPLMEVLRAMGSGWLIAALWTAFGVFLATLFRSTALAIGLGLVYAILLEGVAASLLASDDRYDPIRKALLNENSYALINQFDSPLPQGFSVPASIVEPTQGAIVLGAYTLGFILLSALLFWRRDAT